MKAVIVGGGHNGLICSCYLAREGLDVLVLEQSDRPGGGSRTEEVIPGYRFNTHAAAHNIINMTAIPRELRLAEAGLEYREMDPFASAVFADGRRVRFHRSIERTVDSIAEVDRREARAYREFMQEAVPIVETAVAGLRMGRGTRSVVSAVATQLSSGARVARAGLVETAAELLSPYGAVLDARLLSDLTKGPVSAFAAHAGAGPDVTGGAFFVLWQAAYHLYGQWHPLGGSQSLVDALVRRLESFGARVRCGALVERVDAAGGRARAVVLENGERLEADVVVTAMDPKSALLELLDPPLDGRPGAELAATHRSNTVQMVVHAAADRPPPYTHGRPEDLHGLQSYVDSLDELRRAFRAAEARRMYLPAQFYAFTPSALDDTLAPPGHHAVYLASPAAPYALEGGWEKAAPSVAESMLDQLEERAPGFRASVQGIATRTPEQMECELRWPGAHPMVLDVTPDQLAVMRPTPELADHRTPVDALYITGAGTAPVGGIAGAPGRAAARAVLKDARTRRRKSHGEGARGVP